MWDLLIKALLSRIIWVYERIRWYRWSNRLPKSMTSQEFISILISYRSISVQTDIVKTIRKKRLLRTMQETEAALTQIIQFIETAQQRKEDINKKKSGERASDIYKPLSEKSKMANKINRFILKANAEILDDISRLLEDIRTQVG